MIQRYLIRRCFNRAITYIFYKLETSWWATFACYAVVFAIVFAANYWST